MSNDAASTWHLCSSNPSFILAMPRAQVFELGGDAIPLKMAHNLTRLIAEGAGEGDDAADGEMRAEVVATYLDLLDRPKLSDVLLMVRVQVLAARALFDK